MVRRYIIPCAAVAVLALGIAYAASRSKKPTYASGCVTRFSVPVTTATGTNYFDVQQTVALGELARATRGPMFTDVAGAAGISEAKLAAETKITPGPLDESFVVAVTDAQPKRAASLATALCAELATQMRDQRAAEQATGAANSHDQVASLESQRASIQAAGPFPGSAAQVQALNASIGVDVAEYGITLALPADYITATKAYGAGRIGSTALKKDLEVAGGAIPITCFLMILVAEAVRRPEAAPA